jgi:DNA-binding transcriptional MocR family regulator
MKYPVKYVGLKHLDWVGLVLSTELPTVSKTIVMYLSRFMNKDQDCAWPSWARMMSEIGIAKGTMQKHLDLLESEGWLSRQKGGGANTTRYFVSFPRQIESVLGVQGSSPRERGSSPDERGSSPRELGVVHHVNTNRQYKIDKEIEYRSFDLFWDAYPKKVAKKSALTAFKRLKASDQQKAIADIQSGRYSKTDPQFIPNPSTYLNQERWNDEVKTKAAPNHFAGAI